MISNNSIIAVTFLSLLYIAETTASPSPAFEGRKLYLSHCMICHGFDGKGDGPLAKRMEIEPEDLPAYVSTHTNDYLQRIIAGNDRDNIAKKSGHGDISDMMPRWSSVLSTSDVKSLVAYLRYLSTTKHKLPGDPELGASLYRKYCSICHGTNGDGNGALSNLIGIKPIDHTNPIKTDKLDNTSLAKSILDGEGKYMPAWRDILSTTDVNGIVSYIRLLYQVWGKLEHGGYVIVVTSPTTESDQALTSALLKDTSCSSAANISSTGKSRAVKLGNFFKSRNILIQKTASSTHCLASETVELAFGKSDLVEYLSNSNGRTEAQLDENIHKVESLIGSYSGNGNLLIMTDSRTINELSFEKVDSDNFLVLQPLGGNKYDEIGVYKINY